jgi:hypothetical protein
MSKKMNGPLLTVSQDYCEVDQEPGTLPPVIIFLLFNCTDDVGLGWSRVRNKSIWKSLWWDILNAIDSQAVHTSNVPLFS